MPAFKNGLSSQFAEGYVALRLGQERLAQDLMRLTGMLDHKLGAAGTKAGKHFGTNFVEGMRGALDRISGLVTGSLFAGAAGAAGFLGWGVKLQADAEMAQVAFSTMLSSGERAKALLGSLKQFAIETPFTFPELRDGAKNLLAMGFAANETVPTLRKLGDLSAGLNLPIGEMTTLWGQFRAQGTIMTGDVRQLTTRGIPAIRELAAQFGVAESQVFKLAETGKITFSHLEPTDKTLN